MRAFRFGYQVGTGSAAELIDAARRAEAAGFDVVHTSDHVGDSWAPLAPLAAMASATERVRLCPLVLNNDFHHPVNLAREFAALDQLTGGRMEIGIGAGHSFTEYEALGMPFDPPAVRKARMAEAVEVLRRLFDGEDVTFDGAHYQLRGVRTQRTRQDHLPIFVGVNGKRALAHAARHADTIGLLMLGRTRADGQTHETRWEADRLDATVAHIRGEASDRPSLPELHSLVQSIVITDDRQAAAANVVAGGWAPTVDDALATPFLAIGTHDEIADHLRACRDRWGISYFTVREVDAFA
ncbi:MAG: TIGR03621 family F420-dependent LLM class oxidoreductase, partial [Acidimicrobiia bacterium]